MQSQHQHQQPPSLDDETVCAYCWGPADLETDGCLTQLKCSLCPCRVTTHPECLVAHKRVRYKTVSSRCKAVSTMTGFNCPRVLSKTLDCGSGGSSTVICAGKIISTHRLVWKKPNVAAVPGTAAAPVVVPQANARENAKATEKPAKKQSIIVKKPKEPKKKPVSPPTPAPAPGSNAAARLGVSLNAASAKQGPKPQPPMPSADPPVTPQKQKPKPVDPAPLPAPAPAPVTPPVTPEKPTPAIASVASVASALKMSEPTELFSMYCGNSIRIGKDCSRLPMWMSAQPLKPQYNEPAKVEDVSDDEMFVQELLALCGI